MPDPTVRIRMYRPGLGDCFLLTFENEGTKSHILMDCGIFIGTPNESDRINAIARNIVEETGHRVNAVVATHEHWDHVSGFVRAEKVFADPEQFACDEAWVAWTEDPHQEIATENKAGNRTMTRALTLAIERLEAAESLMDRECGRAIAQVVGFEGENVLAAFSTFTDKGMDFITERAGGKYLEPGDVIERDWLPGVRVYVLGPPKDLAAIRNMSGKEEEGFESKNHGAAMAWAVALGAAENGGAAWQLRPFDEALAWPEQDRSFDPKVEEEVWMSHLLRDRYDAGPWRRIHNDWLLSASQMALQVDNAVNNTSLVLAFELIESRRVLLFPGDAQIGNWKSWEKVKFRLADGTRVSSADLLARTVFYKVGHHGSGNGTLRSGLAAMTSPELVAAIPTHESWASEEKGWEMPAPKLKRELEKKTKGRILRADPDLKPVRKPRRGISDRDWDRFADSITQVDDLFVDYLLPDSAQE